MTLVKIFTRVWNQANQYCNRSGAVVNYQTLEARKGKNVNLKKLNVTKNPSPPSESRNSNAGKVAHFHLRALGVGPGFLLRLCANERCIMSTISPSCVPPVDQPFQRSTNWQKFDTARRIYLVDVPSDYMPLSWRSIPSSYRRFVSPESAVLASVKLNREFFNASIDGQVQEWNVVLVAGYGYGIATIKVIGDWFPQDIFDTPPALAEIQKGDKRKSAIQSLNCRLDKSTNNRKRAYVSISESAHKKAVAYIKHNAKFLLERNQFIG